MYTSYDPPRFVRLLSLLKEHGSEYLSGQDLSDVLKISRIAVWKHIERLRTLGYAIESDKTYGYKLLQQMDTAYPWEITDGIQTKMLGKISYYFDVINSTQDYAIEMAKDQGKNGAVILAGEQDAGRGRGENTWISPKGGIWMSVILGAPSGFEPTLFPIAAAVSLADAIHETLGADTKLKWPNDLLMNDKKVAGIITDAVLDSKGLGQVVLGVGINYNLDVDEIKKSTKRDVAVLNGAGLKVALIQKFLLQLEEQINSMQQDGGTSMIKQWSAISDTIGAKVTVKSDGKIVKGIATRLDPDGALDHAGLSQVRYRRLAPRGFTFCSGFFSYCFLWFSFRCCFRFTQSLSFQRFSLEFFAYSFTQCGFSFRGFSFYRCFSLWFSNRAF